MERQPLGYQQQESSCWITSIMNAMIFLHGYAGKIPNEIARILYAIASKDGTDNDEAERIINFINAYEKLQIKCDLYEGEKVTEEKLRSIIKNGSVIISDVQAGCHSVLVTGIDNGMGKLKIFDPDWSAVCKGGTNIIIVKDKPDYNSLVPFKEFFKKRMHENASLRMGGVRSRSWVVLSLLKNNLSSK